VTKAWLPADDLDELIREEKSNPLKTPSFSKLEINKGVSLNRISLHTFYSNDLIKSLFSPFEK
jgi:hypothetical protein